ncbi:MAG: T9SS type A sorting domain-containing protein [Bacteroidetes bacterium]|nr:T9SS type A sorting domain-containing protein [Bacteroidota bacterium]
MIIAKRYFIFVLCFCFLLFETGAQKHDYIWLSGYDAYPHPVYNELDSFYWATTVLNFNHEPVSVNIDSVSMSFDRTNTSYADNDGALLFYTNGIFIANALNDTIENSDSLNAGWFQYIWDPTVQNMGYRNEQGILAFQDLVNPNNYYLIHSFNDKVLFPAGVYTRNILVTYLDMTANNGHGKVLYKNQEILNNNLGSALAATRHGNGEYWWILVQKRNSNCYYRILIDERGPHIYSDSICLGSVVNDNDYGAACFSPDGSKYVYMSYYTGINIYDFDRCSGLLSNPVNISLPVLVDSGWAVRGVAISPNSHYLYASLTKHLYQFDLWDADIASSIDTIGVYDGYHLPRFNVLQSLFHAAQIAPDGKIYISCGNSMQFYHVINDPDRKGDSCHFVQRGLTLPSQSLGVPSFPNYRLGKLAGSECDTITGLSEMGRTEKENVLRVFPNPATTDVTVDYGFTDWSKSGNVTMDVTNELGQIVWQQRLPQYSGFQRVNVSSYPSGIYITYIKRNNQIIATAKFAKQ